MSGVVPKGEVLGKSVGMQPSNSHYAPKVLEHLEEQSAHPTYFSLFLNKYFKILINNSDCKQNSSARANGP